MTVRIDRCKIIDFPKISDPRGDLTFIEQEKDVPFDIKRVYYIYDVSSGSKRGGHAHKTSEEVIIPISGSFDVKLDDGFKKVAILLNRPYFGLYIAPWVWRVIENFSSNSVALILASTLYNESDYVRNYKVFKKEVRAKDKLLTIERPK